MNKISRRTILRAGAAALVLPILEADIPVAFAANTAAEIPKRLIFLPIGYGVEQQKWFPQENQVGTDYEMPESLMPLEGMRQHFSIIQNLTNRFNPDPHSGTAFFLNCAQSRARTKSVSCDQLAAETLGQETRYRSLIMGRLSRADGHGRNPSCDREGNPIGMHSSVESVYKALFGGAKESAQEIQARLARRQSSLDALTENAKRLNSKISTADRDRVDEYFTTIRSIENRLSKAQEWANTPYPEATFGLPAKLAAKDRLELTFDLIHAAIQSDSTRVLNYMIPSRLALGASGVKGLNPHQLSHTNSDKKRDALARRDTTLTTLLARLMKKLEATKERDGSSLLDHSLIAMGSCLRSGHGMRNGPMILAGHGGGGLKQGQNIVYPATQTPLANLWLSMLRHVDVKTDKFANSNRVLTELGFS